MGNKSRFTRAIPLIAKYLETHEGLLLSQRQLEYVFRERRHEWKLPKAMLAREFIEKLVEQALLAVSSVNLPGGSRLVYHWGAIHPYQLALGLVPHAYLSHQSALELHGLLPAAAQQIFVNHEQRPKPSATRDIVTQAAVDAAFAKPQRQPRYSTTYAGYELVLLNGQATGLLGVTSLFHPEAGELAVTSVERTLLDITVRPAYAGGVAAVLQAFQAATPHICAKKLAQLLEKLNYRYPYHQAIGFYLERAGTYKTTDINQFDQYKKSLDFYLAYRMSEVAYCPKWKVFYPADLDLQ